MRQAASAFVQRTKIIRLHCASQLCARAHAGTGRVSACGMRTRGVHFTTVTPMDLAVPMIELQIDSSGTNSLPGSVFLTCNDAQTLAQRARLNASARLCDFEDVFQRNGPPRRMPRLLASRQDACGRRAASADAEMRKALTLGTAPAAFLIKYVAGGFFTTCAHGSGAERGQTGQAGQALSAMTQAHKVEALVLVRGHKHRQGHIVLTRHANAARSSELGAFGTQHGTNLHALRACVELFAERHDVQARLVRGVKPSRRIK